MNYNFRFLQILMVLVVNVVACLVFTGCSDEDNPEPQNVSIRGYWVCELRNLALEIISERQYYEQKNSNIGGFSEKDNVYQLWYIGDDKPQLYVSWTSQIQYFLFNNLDYSWRDKAYISSCDGENLYLEGIDFYPFKRVTQSYFDMLVNRQNDNTDAGGDSGNDYGNNSGSSEGSQPDKYEAPEVGFYDYTATKNSVTVEYKISNKSDCGTISSHTIYYGTTNASRSASTTMSGQIIKARITGLKSGTTYYVRCKVRGSGGTTTTDVTKVMTEY